MDNRLGADKHHSRVVVIDDDPLILGYFKGQLPKMGFHDIDTHHSLSTARAILQSGECDLVICDLDMPEEDGFDFLSFVNEIHGKFPIIVCSGCNEQLIRVLRKLLKFHSRLNVVEAIMKPVNLLELAKAVAKSRFTEQPRPKSIDSTIKQYSVEQILDNVDVFFQAKWSCRGDYVVGAEALARVIDPDNGQVVSPFFFIPTIKSSQAGTRFTYQIFERSAQYIATIIDLNLSLTFSINIGVNDLKNPQFYRNAMAIFEKYAIPPSRICFEITEDEIYDHDITILANMGRLIIAGYTFSLDDFGTGFSNFERLGQLPIAEIKLDKLFIDHLLEEHSSTELVRAFVNISTSLGLKTVVEGVETAEQLRLVTDLGIDIQQGYYKAKPCPFADFMALAANNTGG
ncbi:EAL domain-containing protein [Ectothiorhodospiraceae bacterium BW-2]|nr:EAL domain-containing protein [Ectothiorhodospiraceae bacterium BW-2]